MNRAHTSLLVLSSAVALLLASECLAADDVIKWRALPQLDTTRSSTLCGHQHREPIDIEFDGHIVKTTAWSQQSCDLILLEPLATDGSGQVYGVSIPQHQSVILKFEPGQGPRLITYWGRDDERCVWAFVPLEPR